MLLAQHQEMSDTLEVTVVMSVYNDAAYLRDSIESILHQEGVSFEFIVIDDGSIDCSGAIIDEYAAKDPRLQVLHQENQGLTRSLITGCSMARGKYIARQDSDDISFSGRLRRLTLELDSHKQAAVVASSSAMIGPRGEFLFNKYSEADPIDPETDTFCHGSLMFRRDVYERFGGYRSEFSAAQDVDLQFRLAEAGQVRFIPDLLYAYRIDERSISARSPLQKRLAQVAELARDARRAGEDESKILADAARNGSAPSRAKRSEAGTGNYFIGRCLYAQRDRRALSYLWGSCKTRPFSLRYWLAFAQAVLLTKSTRGRDVTLTGIVPRKSGSPGRRGPYVHANSPTF
jgi:glycosyltransferase involved in cell wall biosynthesis